MATYSFEGQYVSAYNSWTSQQYTVGDYGFAQFRITQSDYLQGLRCYIARWGSLGGFEGETEGTYIASVYCYPGYTIQFIVTCENAGYFSA